MKKCPLCGKEYEEGTVCPSCNVLLIDMESGKAVGEEKRGRKERLKKETVKSERVKTEWKGTAEGNLHVPPAVILGVLALAAAVVIIAGVFWFVNREKTSSPDTMYGEDWYADSYEEGGSYTDSSDSMEQTETDSESLNAEDFINSEPVENGTEEYSFMLPAYWQELCTAEVSGDALYYYQNRSRASEAGGYLFSIQKMSSDYYSSDYFWLAESDGMVYALVRPEEPAYDTADPYAKLEYERLMEDISYVNNSFMLEEIQGESEYIFAQSDSEYLSRSDLEGLTEQELSYARNEIYARHGRRFQDAGLQSYFDSKDWYSGTVEPEDFTESMLNEYEKANAELILEYEKDKGYRK